jgi:hypothetical protein
LETEAVEKEGVASGWQSGGWVKCARVLVVVWIFGCAVFYFLRFFAAFYDEHRLAVDHFLKTYFQ